MATAERALLHRGGRRGTWRSLGLWRGGDGDGDDNCAGACEALALAVGQAAGLQRGDGVLSVACGAGDELLLHGAARLCGVPARRISRTAWHPDWRRPGLTARLIGPCRAAGLGYVPMAARRPATA